MQARLDERRGTPVERGYDAAHRQRALALRHERRACCLCGHGIDYRLRSPDPGSFSVQHLTPDKAGPIDAAHRRCNERAGSPSSL
jgi:hypothetical protein